MKLEFLGGRVYRLHINDSDKYDIVRYISDMYRSSPEDFRDVRIEIVYDMVHPISTKDKNFIKWRIKSFTAGNVAISFHEERGANDDNVEKVIPLKPKSKKRKQEKMVTEDIVNTSGEEKSLMEMVGKSLGMLELLVGTLRSGDEIDVDSGVIVVGDVHAGADIYARGPVIILGSFAGRLILSSEKAYSIVKYCENGVVIWNGRAYECKQGKGTNVWTLIKPSGSKIVVSSDKIGVLARRVKEWLEE